MLSLKLNLLKPACRTYDQAHKKEKFEIDDEILKIIDVTVDNEFSLRDFRETVIVELNKARISVRPDKQKG